MRHAPATFSRAELPSPHSHATSDRCPVDVDTLTGDRLQKAWLSVSTAYTAAMSVTAARQPQKVFLDGLNFCYVLFPDGTPHQNLDVLLKNVNALVTAAKASGYELTVFVDDLQVTLAKEDVWMDRREKQLESRNVGLQGMSTLLTDAFRACGASIRYAVNVDNDIAMASHAELDGAIIVSRDNDFAQFQHSTFAVRDELKVANGRLTLTMTDRLAERMKRLPKIKYMELDPPPALSSEPYLQSHITYKGRYRRGVTTCLNKECGNPHIDARPLRQAVYARRKIPGPVIEIFPVWDAATVSASWTNDQVEPDDAWDEFLDKPAEAFDRIFPKSKTVRPSGVSDEDWENHLSSLRCVVYELCVMGRGIKKSLLELLMDHYGGLSKASSQASSSSSRHADMDDLLESLGASMSGLTLDSKAKLVYTFRCIGCGINDGITQYDYDYFISMGFVMPRRCKVCKKTQKAMRAAGISTGRGRGRGRGQSRSFPAETQTASRFDLDGDDLGSSHSFGDPSW
ncbi:hypothetical protein BC831DRAFT_489771 [Entophlyctis helioformis]|nr:hypothetical protein BC831DRAFT_489771 [Entophlyctis helioformis]